MNKKAQLAGWIVESWAELGFVILLILGFIISLALSSSFFTYLTSFLTGILAGRVFYYKSKKERKFPYILIIVGFILGFLFGAVSANKLIILVLFLAGTLPSYYLHKKGYFGFFKSAGYIK